MSSDELFAKTLLLIVVMIAQVGRRAGVVEAGSRPSSLADWMAKESEARAKLRPFEFCYPGTHESGASKEPTGDWIVGQSQALNILARFRGIRKLASNWVITQPDQSIYDQLVGGIRYLDLRIASTTHTGRRNGEGAEVPRDVRPRDSSAPRQTSEASPSARDSGGNDSATASAGTGADGPIPILVHLFSLGTLLTAMEEIERFVVEHPTELIVISSGPYFDVHLEQATARQFIEERLGKYACPIGKLVRLPAGNYHSDEDAQKQLPTIQNILDEGHRVMLHWDAAASDEKDLKSDSLWLFDQHLIYAYRGESRVQEKQDFLKMSLATYVESSSREEKAGGLYQLPYTVTPDSTSIMVDVILNRNLIDHARMMNPTLEPFVFGKLTEKQRDAVNVISVDDFANSAVVHVCRDLIKERLKRHT